MGRKGRNKGGCDAYAPAKPRKQKGLSAFRSQRRGGVGHSLKMFNDDNDYYPHAAEATAQHGKSGAEHEVESAQQQYIAKKKFPVKLAMWVCFNRVKFILTATHFLHQYTTSS